MMLHHHLQQKYLMYPMYPLHLRFQMYLSYLSYLKYQLPLRYLMNH